MLSEILSVQRPNNKNFIQVVDFIKRNTSNRQIAFLFLQNWEKDVLKEGGAFRCGALQAGAGMARMGSWWTAAFPPAREAEARRGHVDGL